MIIYKITNHQWTGESKESDGIPIGWVASDNPPTKIGQTYSNGTWINSQVPIIIDINERKTEMNTEINEIRYSKIYQESIPYTFPGDTEPDGIQMRDEVDRQNIQDFVIDAMSRDSSDVMYFMPVSNTLKSLTPQEAITMGLTLKARGDSIIGYSWALKTQINNAENIEDLNSMDINTGWPE